MKSIPILAIILIIIAFNGVIASQTGGGSGPDANLKVILLGTALSNHQRRPGRNQHTGVGRTGETAL